MPSPLIVFIIHKNEFAQALKAAVKSFAIISLGKLIDKTDEIWILRDHKSRNRDIQFPAAGCQVKRTVDYFSVEAKRILIILFTFFDASWFPISDHKDLFVGISAAAEQIHG